MTPTPRTGVGSPRVDDWVRTGDSCHKIVGFLSDGRIVAETSEEVWDDRGQLSGHRARDLLAFGTSPFI